MLNGYADALAAYADGVKVFNHAVASAKPGDPLPAAPGNLPSHPLNSNYNHTGLYNGMIHPIVPFGIRGFLWYQGESNNGQGMHYFQLKKGLIEGWRSVWNQEGNRDFPFLFAQLAPYNYGGDPTRLAGIWEAQTATLSVKNTGMAVLTDITTIGDIHPPNKQEVGRRLGHTQQLGLFVPLHGPVRERDEHLVSLPKTQRVVKPDAASAQALSQRHHRAGLVRPKP